MVRWRVRMSIVFSTSNLRSASVLELIAATIVSACLKIWVKLQSQALGQVTLWIGLPSSASASCSLRGSIKLKTTWLPTVILPGLNVGAFACARQRNPAEADADVDHFGKGPTSSGWRGRSAADCLIGHYSVGSHRPNKRHKF